MTNMDETNMEVDKLTSYEFITQVYNEIPPTTLYEIGIKLEKKSEVFKALLTKEKVKDLTYDEIKKIVKFIFPIKKASKKWNEEEYMGIRSQIYDLLFSEEDLKLRFNNFCFYATSTLKIERPFTFASEVLHYYDPDKYWLWANWMFDPKTNTGSLLLLLEEGIVLEDLTYGKKYEKIGNAIQSVEEIASEIGIREPNSVPTSKFELTVFLCAVFAVYMYTVTRMRMTKEFNTVLPKMTELIYRLLGIYQKKAASEVKKDEN